MISLDLSAFPWTRIWSGLVDDEGRDESLWGFVVYRSRLEDKLKYGKEKRRGERGM